MTARGKFNGIEQRAALVKFQEESGRAPTEIAADLGLSDPQYRRYVWGKLPLRTDQFAPFARAYGIPVRRLIEAVFRAELAAESFDFRAYLRAAGIPEEAIEEQAETWEGKGPKDQKAGADGIIRMFREEQAAQARNRPA